MLDLIFGAIILRRIFFLNLDWKLDSNSWGWISFLGQHFCQELVGINNKPEKFNLLNHMINFTPYTNTLNLFRVFSLFQVYLKDWNFSRYLSRITLKLNHYESVFFYSILTDTRKNEPKCAVYFWRGAESYSFFRLLNYFLWWEVNSVVALCTLWLKFASGQVSSPRLHRLTDTQQTQKVRYTTVCPFGGHFAPRVFYTPWRAKNSFWSSKIWSRRLFSSINWF